MKNQKVKMGAPKKYKERTQINHTIEADVLQRIDEKAELGHTRTDIINEAIIEWLNK